MSEVERIVKEVDGSMSMEGLPLSTEDKERIERCLNNPRSFDDMIHNLLKKHMVVGNS